MADDDDDDDVRCSHLLHINLYFCMNLTLEEMQLGRMLIFVPCGDSFAVLL